MLVGWGLENIDRGKHLWESSEEVEQAVCNIDIDRLIEL